MVWLLEGRLGNGKGLEEEEEGEGNEGKGERVFVPEKDKGLFLGREEIDVTHKKMVICKCTKRNPCYGEVFNFN